MYFFILIYNRKGCKAKETEVSGCEFKTIRVISDDSDLVIIPKKFKYGKEEVSGICRNNELPNKGIYFHYTQQHKL